MGFFTKTTTRTVKCYDEDDEEGLMALHREWCDYSAATITDRDDKYNSLEGIGEGWWDEEMAEERESYLPSHCLPSINHKQAMKKMKTMKTMKTVLSTLTMAIAKS
jgi:hypothetical protein